VDEEINIPRQSAPGYPVGRPVEPLPAQDRLVVGHVCDGAPIFAYAIADSGTWVGDEVCPDAELTDLKVAAGRVVKDEVTGQFPETHREEGWGKVPAEALSQVHRGGRRAPDVHAGVWREQGLEKAETLNMVHV
jgi:hypothetical protein